MKNSRPVRQSASAGGLHPEPLRRGPVVAEAARLGAAGWRVLFTDERKRALFLDGHQEHGHLDATSDLAEIEARVQAAGGRIRGAGLAVQVGGDQPFVVDLDGECAVEWARRSLGSAFERIPRERTRRGMHLFFAPASLRRQVRWTPPGWRCECGAGCGIDLLGYRGDDARQPAQLVVIAPSAGREWVWPDRLPPPDALPALPDGWLAQEPRRRVVPLPPAAHHDLAPGEIGSATGLKELDRICTQIETAEPGRRHDTLLRLGVLAGGWVGAGHLAAEYAAARLAGAVRGPAADPVKDLATARDAIAFGAARPLEPGVRPLPTAAETLPTTPPPPVEIGEARERLRELTDGVRVGSGRLVVTPPGVGKTTRLVPATAAAEIAGGGGFLDLTPTKELVSQADRALQDADVTGVSVHVGRHPGAGPGECPVLTLAERGKEDGLTASLARLTEYAERKAGAISEFASQRHAIQPNACRDCIIGRNTMLRRSANLRRSGEDALERTADRAAVLNDQLRQLGIRQDDLPECGWIVQQLRERGDLDGEPEPPAGLVATHSSLTHDLLTRPAGGGLRLAVFDETPELTETVTVKLSDVSRWLARAREIRDAWATEATEDAAAAARLDALDRVIEALRTIALRTADLLDKEALLDAWGEFGTAAAALVNADTTAATAAPWEEVVAVAGEDGWPETLVPLRAIADAIAFALPRRDAGAFEVVTGAENGVRFVAPRPAAHALLGDWPGVRVALFDATPPWAVRRLVEVKGWEIIDEPVRIGRVEVHTGRTFSRGRWSALRRQASTKDQARAALAMRRDVRFIADAILAHAARRPGSAVGVISHKPLIEQLQDEMRTGALRELADNNQLRVGWFGRDDRGSNAFAGCDLLVFGAPLRSPRDERQALAADRALLHGLVEVPQWCTERVRLARRLCDGRVVPMQVMGPADPVLRERWDYQLSAAMAQVAGRARPADHPDAEIHTWSGFVPDLGRFGFEVEVVEQEDQPTALEEVRQLHHLRSMERVVVAAAALERDGQRLSVRHIQNWCHAKGLPVPRNRNVMKWLAELRESGCAPDDAEAMRQLVDELQKVADRLGEQPQPAEVEAALAAEIAEVIAEDRAAPEVVAALRYLASPASVRGTPLAARAGP